MSVRELYRETIRSYRDALQIFYRYYETGQSKFSLANEGFVRVHIKSYIGEMEDGEPVNAPLTIGSAFGIKTDDDILYYLITTEQYFEASINYYPLRFDEQVTIPPSFTRKNNHYTSKDISHPEDLLLELANLLFVTGGLAPHEGTYKSSHEFISEIINLINIPSGVNSVDEIQLI